MKKARKIKHDQEEVSSSEYQQDTQIFQEQAVEKSDYLKVQAKASQGLTESTHNESPMHEVPQSQLLLSESKPDINFTETSRADQEMEVSAEESSIKPVTDDDN